MRNARTHEGHPDLAPGPLEKADSVIPTRRSARRWLVLLGVGLVVLLSGCGVDGPHPQTTFDPKGPEARMIDNLIVPIFVVAGIIGLIVFAAVFWVMLKYRRGRFTGDDVPEQVHGNPKLEIGWTILPAIIMAVIAVPTVNVIFELASKPQDPLEINVIGQQWWWEFDYPGSNVVTANEIVFPAGRPVQVNITSRDVIHSFWVPALNGKRDAIPGRTSSITIQADEPGEFMGACTEYCGLSHANMLIRAVALTEDDFQQWLADQQRAASLPDTEAALAGLEVYNNRGCGSCHMINGEGIGQQPVVVPQVSGAAPNLTHFMTRSCYAGCIFDLYTPTGAVDVPTLEAWLRNSPAMKPMYPEGGRGMPAQNLSEQEIKDLVAYLTTLQ